MNGRIYNLQRHESRMQQSRVALFAKDLAPISLRKHIRVPSNFRKGLVKCRILYGEELDGLTYTAYQTKNIKSLKLVHDNSINYEYKFLDRDHINELYTQREDCDDIIIVKDGMLTDCSYSNLALLKKGKWYTPTTCLLQGTRRQQLIDQGRLIERPIFVEDINQYESISLVNAMIGLGKIRLGMDKIIS